jgi:hypothetical protein
MTPFIHITSAKFSILPGEAEQIINEGTYGKALAEYLTVRLRDLGYSAPFFCCEDWGWWVELVGYPFTFGLCIYGRVCPDGSLEHYLSDGGRPARRWSWRHLRFVDTGVEVTAAVLRNDLVAIFRADPDVHVLAIDLDSMASDEVQTPPL